MDQLSIQWPVEARPVGYGVTLPVLSPSVKVLEGSALSDVAASDMLVNPAVLIDEASVSEYGAKLLVPAPRKVELRGLNISVREDVAACHEAAAPRIFVDWLARDGNGGDSEIDPPTTSVEALLTVIARYWTCAGDARQ